MKIGNKSILMSVIAIGALAVSSCAPVYKCGEPVPEKQKGGKRLLTVVSERDSLCVALADQHLANARLSTDNKNLKNNLSGQENINENQSEELSRKNRDLLNKERMLREMQAIISRQDEVTKKLNETLRGALVGFSPDELTMEIRDGKVYVSMSDKLLFKSGSAAVEPKGVEALQVLADVPVSYTHLRNTIRHRCGT